MRLQENINKANLQLWLDALRSDEFEQATSRLQVRDSTGKLTYCCLGVACVVAARNSDSEEFKAEMEDALEHDSLLPRSVAKWLGLDLFEDDFSVNLYVRDEEDEITTVTYLNDSGGNSFPAIADRIEAGLYR